MRKTALLFLAMFVISINVSMVKAASPAHNSAVLVLDKSGSMKKSDPSFIRWDAVDLMLYLMKNEDKIAVVTFGTNTEDILGGAISVDEGVRKKIKLAPQRRQASDYHTDILAALQAAEKIISELGEAHRRAYPPSVVILTDGLDDVKNAAPNRSEQVDKVLKSIVALGGKVHGIGLSAGADRDILQRFQALTGGESILITNPEDLLASYLNLSRELGDRWLLWDGQTDGKTVSFELPEWIEEITIVFIPDSPGKSSVFQANGIKADLVASRYQVLKIPGEGKKTLTLNSGGKAGRFIADASGDLVISAEVPAVVPSGIPFPVKVKIHAGHGQELGPGKFLEELSASIVLTDALKHDQDIYLYDDGTHDDGSIKDGVFGGRCIIGTPGNTDFKAGVKAPFSRNLQSLGAISALENPINIEEPGVVANLLSSFGKPLSWTIANVSDVEIPIRAAFIIDEKIVDTHTSVLPALGEITVSSSFEPNMFGAKKIHIRFFLDEQANPVSTSEVSISPIGMFIIILVLIVLLILAGFFFPQRSLKGSSLGVFYFEEEDDDPEGKTFLFTRDNADASFDLPLPFGSPGTFEPRHGFWRKGLIFIPPAGIVPVFSGKRPSRVGNGYLIERAASWSITSGLSKAKYSLKAKW